MYIAPRLEVQYKDSTIVKINLFSGINGQQKVQAVHVGKTPGKFNKIIYHLPK